MTDPTPSALPEAHIRPPRRISWFWLLPLIAFIIGGMLFFQIWQERGKQITITFNDGAGITANKTVVRYQGLQIGVVKKVTFAEGMKKVQVEAEINPEAKSVLKEETRFWLVKPSVSLAGISGLDSLVSGNYITLLPGAGAEEDNFVAEDEAPAVAVNEGDLFIKLISRDLGSLSAGSAIYFRKVPVGSILYYRLSKDKQSVELDVVISKQYASLIKKDSRFWNVSGLKADLSLKGASVEMDSLISAVQGGVSFDSPDNSPEASAGESYTLYDNLKAAQRGVTISVALPSGTDLKANETAVYYQGSQIGVLSSLQGKTEGENALLRGELLIDPAMANLFTTQSHIVLKHSNISLQNIQLDQLDKLLQGDYLDVIAGEGSAKRQFTVESEADYLAHRPNTLVLTLTAPESFGVAQGQGIFYKDVKIGEVLRRDLTRDGVRFHAIIYPGFHQLIYGDSQFIAASNLSMNVGLNGVKLDAASPSTWLQGGIRVINAKNEGKAKAHYPLYANESNAAEGITDSQKTPTLWLTANTLSGIDAGSPLLYREFQVGEVLSIQPDAKQFRVGVYVSPRYRQLLSAKSRFWLESPVKVNLSLQGLSVESSPLMRALKGAISFDNGATGSENNTTADKSNKTASRTYPLYANADAAQNRLKTLSFEAENGQSISQGMALKYLGVTVGEVKQLEIDTQQPRVNITASLQTRYFDLLARAGTRFEVITPAIDVTGIKNLDALVQPYIQITPAKGDAAAQTHFVLNNNGATSANADDGVPFWLETADANGIVTGAPLLYRGLPVGSVSGLQLSEMGDRVLVEVRVTPRYAHLVRETSQFWETSGYSMHIGLNGAELTSGTLSQLLKGGIAFGNPTQKVVPPRAEPNRHFLLQHKAPANAASWSMAIAP